VADGAARLERGIERVDGRSRHPERTGNPLALENENRSIDCAHPGHVRFPWFDESDNAPRRMIFQFFQKCFSLLRRAALQTDFAGFLVFQSQ
jgi:hypothetical protein